MGRELQRVGVGTANPQGGKPGSISLQPIKAGPVPPDLPALQEKPEKSQVLNAGNDFKFPKKIMKAHTES